MGKPTGTSSPLKTHSYQMALGSPLAGIHPRRWKNICQKDILEESLQLPQGNYKTKWPMATRGKTSGGILISHKKEGTHDNPIRWVEFEENVKGSAQSNLRRRSGAARGWGTRELAGEDGALCGCILGLGGGDECTKTPYLS